VGDKQLAFYHFLTGFIGYCRLWLAHHERRTEQSVVPGRPLEQPKSTSFLRVVARYVALSFLRMRRMTKRRHLYEICFTRNQRTGNLYVTDIVNSCWGSF